MCVESDLSGFAKLLVSALIAALLQYILAWTVIGTPTRSSVYSRYVTGLISWADTEGSPVSSVNCD